MGETDQETTGPREKHKQGTDEKSQAGMIKSMKGGEGLMKTSQSEVALELF